MVIPDRKKTVNSRKARWRIISDINLLFNLTKCELGYQGFKINR